MRARLFPPPAHRRLRAGQLEEQVRSPRIRDDDSRDDDEEQRKHGPYADHVVPVPFPGSALKATAKHQPIPEARKIENLRQPQVHPRQKQKEEYQVAGAGDATPECVLHPKPEGSVDTFNRAEECACLLLTAVRQSPRSRD